MCDIWCVLCWFMRVYCLNGLREEARPQMLIFDINFYTDFENISHTEQLIMMRAICLPVVQAV